MREEFPSGTVTFVFTDIEGSTRLLYELGDVGYAEALAEHRRVIREACGAGGGFEVDTQGDAFFFAFPTAPGALVAAASFTGTLASGRVRVRVGVHSGTPLLTEEGYVGHDVQRAARIAAAGHGGQVLVSMSTAALFEPGNAVSQPTVLHDLGLHRLKDLSAPERIYQLGHGEFPPLKSLYRTNLPVPATAFLGRERELVEVGELLSRDGVRLLTLTGSGGTGKTRLALQAVAQASDAFPQGVFWVPLAPLRDPALVLQEASRAVGARDGLTEHLADKRLLLLFDNFEHLIDAAGLLADLLGACPNLRLVVTSREVLQLPGEQVYPVPPLAEEDGVELFTARARASFPGFTPSAAATTVCERLDHLPLALELAAARVRILSPEQLLERLGSRLDLLKAGRGVDPRQQTLRATLEWSHDLLDEGEQRFFARLAVFRGGCTLDAAEHICDADLDTVQALVDKSLLRYNEERYWMLETIREYAVEQLDASGEVDQLRRRHVDWFLALAREAEPHLRRKSAEWLDRIEREHDNLRAALDRLDTLRESERALELAAALCWFWGLRGHLLEGRQRVERALDGDKRRTRVRADALMGAADFALDCGDLATARVRAEEALAIQRTLGDVWGAAYTLVTMGLTFAEDGSDWEAAHRCFDESVQLFSEIGDEHEELEARRRLAWSYESLGDRDRARALHEENLRRAHAAGDDFVAARSLGVLGTFHLDDGRIDEAVPLFEEGFRLHRARFSLLPDQYWAGIMVCRFARALDLSGAPVTAARLLSCFEKRSEEIEGKVEAWVVEMNDVTLSHIRFELDEADLDRAWADGQSLTIDEAIELALEALGASGPDDGGASASVRVEPS